MVIGTLVSLAVLGAVLGTVIGILAKADRWRVLGRALVGASGSTVAGFPVWLVTESIIATALSGLLFAYLVIATTSGSVD
jgi:hypothetical protein